MPKLNSNGNFMGKTMINIDQASIFETLQTNPFLIDPLMSTPSFKASCKLKC